MPIQAAKNADQDDSHRYDGRWGRSCQSQAWLKALARPGGNVTGITSFANGPRR